MLTLIKRPRTSLRNGKKPRQWKFGRLKLVLHCNACCANTTKYTTSSSTLKTRNGLAKSEPRSAAQARSGLQHREAARTASSAKVEPLCRHHRVVLQVSFIEQNERSVVRLLFIDALILPNLHRLAAARTRITIAWDDDILPSLPVAAQIATMKIRTPARCERSPDQAI
jgi:hypothetical protein